MDYYTDSGHLFAKIFASFELPGFTKEGAYATEAELRDVPGSAFADSDRRLFPIYDRANVFVSAAYAYAQPHLKVAQDALPAIEKAAALLEIESSLDH